MSYSDSSESDYSTEESAGGEMEPHTSDEDFLASDDEVEGGRAASPDDLTAHDEAQELLRDLKPGEKGLVASRTVNGKRRSGRAKRPVQRYVDPNAQRLLSDNGKDTPNGWEKDLPDQPSTDSKDSTYVPGEGGFAYDDDESGEEEEEPSDDEEEPSSDEEEPSSDD
jgi:hypothetical protein